MAPPASWFVMLPQHLPLSGSESPPAQERSLDVSPSLLRAIHHAGISVYCQDRDRTILWAQNIPSFWAAGRIVGLKDEDFLSPAEAGRLASVKERVIASARGENCEISIEDADGTHWFDVWIDLEPEGGTGHDCVLTTAVETTEHKHREQTLKTLLREVSHRSKNLLAIIQSIATQTGRYSGSIEVFLSRFRGRLQSLAASQDLVTLSNWRGADLRELISNQVGRYAADPRNAVHFSGANPYLNPNAALHVGLALHELAVNSVSYGALSQPGGSIEIEAAHSLNAEGQKVLRLNWREPIPAPAEEKIEKRFGSVALERVVPASLKGEAHLEIGSGRLQYTLIVPAGTAGLD